MRDYKIMINKGFKPKRNIDQNKKLPPGQYTVDDLPILTAGPTPKIDNEIWNLEIMKNDELILSINWNDLMTFPQSNFVTDIHCVTKWSIFDTSWKGVYIDHIIENTELKSFNGFILAESYGGYTTNLPTNDLIDKKYIKTMLKSELAGQRWGRDELWGVRIMADNQILGALKHFNEADAFLVQSN